MAVSVVQRVTNTAAAAASLTVTFSAAVNGNRMIAIFAVNDVNTNVTGPTGWARASNIDSANTTTEIWQMRAAGGETTATWTFSAGKNAQVVFLEVDGLNKVTVTTGAGDRAITGTNTAATQTLTAVNPNQLPDDIEVMGCSMSASGGAFVSVAAGWTNETGANGLGTGLLYAASRIVSPPAVETASGTITWTTSRLTAGGLASFRGSSLDGPWPLITS